MSSKKTASRNKTIDDKIAFTRAQEKLSKTLLSCGNAMNDFKAFYADHFKNLEDHLVEKRKELDLVDAEHGRKVKLMEQEFEDFKTSINGQKKTVQLAFENELVEYKMGCVEKFVKANGRCVVSEKEYDLLASHAAELADLNAQFNVTLETQRKELVASREKAIKAVTATCEMKASMEAATLRADSDANARLVTELKVQIAAAEKRLDEQRKLTQQIAEAGSKGQIVQNLGGMSK